MSKPTDKYRTDRKLLGYEICNDG